MMKKLTLASAVIMAGLISCKRETGFESTSPKPQPQATTTKELKLSTPFDWKTTKTVTVSAIATQLPTSIKHVISIQGDDGITYATFSHAMNENLSTKITVPTTVNKIFVHYGAITKEVAINDTSASFNFLKK